MNLISHVDPMFFVRCKFEKQTNNIWPCLPKRGWEWNKQKQGNIQVKVLVPWFESFVSTGFECHTWERTNQHILEKFKVARICGLTYTNALKVPEVLPVVRNYKIPMDRISTKPTGSIMMTVDGFWAIYENIPRTSSHWGSLHQEVHEDTRWVPSCP